MSRSNEIRATPTTTETSTRSTPTFITRQSTDVKHLPTEDRLDRPTSETRPLDDGEIAQFGVGNTDEEERGVEVDHSSDVPEGGYGWVIVGCLIAINASTWGMNTSYGVFSAYYLQNNYFEGGSTFRYAWVGGLSVAVALACGPLANWVNRTWGLKFCLIIGWICTTLGQCMAGICTHYYTFMVCQGIIFGMGIGFPLIATSPLVAHYFQKRLSLAQGIANAGSGLGGLVFSNVTRVTLEKYGVKWALIINGLTSMVIMLPTIVLTKGRHEALKAKSLSLEIKWFVHPGFVWILLWACCCMIAYFVALYSLASFATGGLGLSQTQGASLQSILAASQMIGRPLWGMFLDRGGRTNMSIICYIIVGLSSLCIWLPAKSYGVLAFFAVVQGATSGTIWSAATPLTAQMIGVQDLGSALSIFWLTLLVPALVGQPLAILLLEYSRNEQGRTGAGAYYNSIGFCGAMGLGASVFLLGAKRYQQGNWKILTKS